MPHRPSPGEASCRRDDAGRTEVRRLSDGTLEVRHLEFAPGVGWYGAQRMVLAPQVAATLGHALLTEVAPAPRAAGAQPASEVSSAPSDRPVEPEGGTKVVSLAAWREATRRGD